MEAQDLSKSIAAENFAYHQEELDNEILVESVDASDSFEVLKNDTDTLYLLIKQVYFDAIVNGSKKAEYREIKSTTANKYLLRDTQQKFVINTDVADVSKEYFIDDYNKGKFPFVPKPYKHLYLAVGYEKERDTCIVEIDSTSFIPNMVRANLYAFWQIGYNLGEVIEVRRKRR